MPAKRCSGRSGKYLFGRDPVASLSLSRGRRGDGILFIRPYRKLDGGRSATLRSPRSGRAKIAQRFIAGCASFLLTSVREADDRVSIKTLANGFFLSPVSR